MGSQLILSLLIAAQANASSAADSAGPQMMLNALIEACAEVEVSDDLALQEIDYKDMPYRVREWYPSPRRLGNQGDKIAFYEFDTENSYLIKFERANPDNNENMGYCHLVSRDVDLDDARVFLLQTEIAGTNLSDFSQFRKMNRTSSVQAGIRVPHSLPFNMIDKSKHPKGFVLAGPDHSFELIGTNFGRSTRGRGFRLINFLKLSEQKQDLANRAWQRHLKRQNTESDLSQKGNLMFILTNKGTQT